MVAGDIPNSGGPEGVSGFTRGRLLERQQGMPLQADICPEPAFWVTRQHDLDGLSGQCR